MISARDETPELEATRRQLLSLLRRGTSTVDALARRLGVTDNAVRFHLAALVQDGTVERHGERKGTGAGKPAGVYGLSRKAEAAFSLAYAPVLAACVLELRETMSTSQLLAFLKRVGRRLAGAGAATRGPLAKRVATASSVLNELGGITTVE